jgi:hypothetical protein
MWRLTWCGTGSVGMSRACVLEVLFYTLFTNSVAEEYTR